MYPDLFKGNSSVINVSHTLSLLILIAYYVTVPILSTFLDWGTFNFIQLCLDKPKGDSIIMFWTIIAPNLVLIIITIVLDYKTMVKINQVADVIQAELKSKANDRKRRDRIAKRAIYINVGLFLPWILYSGTWFLYVLAKKVETRN